LVYRITLKIHLLSILKGNKIIDNTTPVMRACCVLIKAVKLEKFNMTRSKITSALDVTDGGVKMALKRLKDPIKSL
jgi:hypothetical protein